MNWKNIVQFVACPPGELSSTFSCQTNQFSLSGDRTASQHARDTKLIWDLQLTYFYLPVLSEDWIYKVCPLQRRYPQESAFWGNDRGRLTSTQNRLCASWETLILQQISPNAPPHACQVMHRLDIGGPSYGLSKKMLPGKWLWEKCQVQVQKCKLQVSNAQGIYWCFQSWRILFPRQNSIPPFEVALLFDIGTIMMEQRQSVQKRIHSLTATKNSKKACKVHTTQPSTKWSL